MPEGQAAVDERQKRRRLRRCDWSSGKARAEEKSEKRADAACATEQEENKRRRIDNQRLFKTRSYRAFCLARIWRDIDDVRPVQSSPSRFPDRTKICYLLLESVHVRASQSL